MDNQQLIQHGKALIMAIQGLQSLDDTKVIIGVIESHLRPQLIKAYQRELKKIIATVSQEEAGEILMAMKSVSLPTSNPNLN